MSKIQSVNQTLPKEQEQEKEEEERKRNILDSTNHVEEYCKTPKNYCKNVISTSPPPAPKKLKKKESFCKRKFDFFEVTGNEELELFFRSCNEVISRVTVPSGIAIKKRLF